MNLKDRDGNSFISEDDLKRLHEGVKILLPLKTKYYKLGKIIASSEISVDLKNQFFSFGREMDKIVSLWERFGDN